MLKDSQYTFISNNTHKVIVVPDSVFEYVDKNVIRIVIRRRKNL